MISGDFTHCTSLEQFSREIIELQNKAHGEHYCDVHNAIKAALSGRQKIYVELGINQGATLATAALQNPGMIWALDVHIERFDPHRKFFRKGGFAAFSGSSIDPKHVIPCDVLYIDTVHTWTHLNKELDLWASKVSETIICHDTHAKMDLRTGIDTWVRSHPEWVVKEHNVLSVGYSVLERK